MGTILFAALFAVAIVVVLIIKCGQAEPFEAPMRGPGERV